MACAEALQAHAHAIPNSKTNRPLFQIPFFLCFLHQFLHLLQTKMKIAAGPEAGRNHHLPWAKYFRPSYGYN